MTGFPILHGKKYNEVGWKLNEDIEFFPSCLRSHVAGKKTKTKHEGGLEQGIVLKAKEFDYLRKSDIACSRLSVVGDERKKKGDKNGKFNKALPNDNVLKSVYTHMS